MQQPLTSATVNSYLVQEPLRHPHTHVTARLLQGWRALGRVEVQTRVMVLLNSIIIIIMGLLSSHMVTIWGLAEDCKWMVHPISQDLLAVGGTLLTLVSMGLSRGKGHVEHWVDSGLSRLFSPSDPLRVHLLSSPHFVSKFHSRVTTRSHEVFAAFMPTACLTLPSETSPW